MEIPQIRIPEVFIPQIKVPTLPGILGFFLNSFVTWINIMIQSFLNPVIVWLTLPIYFSWFITEWFSEKEETSYGSAATNAMITVYVALDWLRQMFYGEISFTIWKFAIGIGFLVYGIYVAKEAIALNPVARYLGAIRTVSYFQITFTVILYSEFTKIPFSLESILGIFLGYPIVYGITRLIDRFLPEVVEE